MRLPAHFTAVTDQIVTFFPFSTSSGWNTKSNLRDDISYPTLERGAKASESIFKLKPVADCITARKRGRIKKKAFRVITQST